MALLGPLAKPRVAAGAIALLLAGFAVVGATRAVNDPDVFWLATAGRFTLEHGRVLRENTFSYTEPTTPWVMHEWLLGPLYAAGFARFGAIFFDALAVTVGLGTAWLALRLACARVGSSVAAGLVGFLLLAPLASILAGPRPSMMTAWLSLAMIALAFRPWSLPHALAAIALELAWAQVHGSFPLGLVLLGAGLLQAGGPRARWAVLAAAAGVTVLNPYGLALHGLVASYGTGSGVTSALQASIVEFRPLWRAWGTPWLDPATVGASACVLALALRALAKRRNLREALLALALLALAVRQVRHLTLAILVGTVLLAPEVETLVPAAERWAERTQRGFVRIAVVPALVVATIALVAAGGTRSREDWIAPSLGGSGALELARALPEGARVFTPLGTAGLVEWTAGDRARVFIDARNDCYGEATWRDYEAIRDGGPNARAILRAHGTTHVLASASDPDFADLPVVGRAGNVVLYAVPE